MKHLRAWTKNGWTFGMEVDGVRAAKVLKHSEYIERKFIINGHEYTRREPAIRAPYIASLMGTAAWQVTECQDFTHVQIDDSPKYKVIYKPLETVS